MFGCFVKLFFAHLDTLTLGSSIGLTSLSMDVKDSEQVSMMVYEHLCESEWRISNGATWLTTTGKHPTIVLPNVNSILII